MKMIMNLLLICLLLISVTACGGGGGNDTPPPDQQQQAVLSLSLSGGTDTLGSLQFELLLPEGFNLAIDEQGQLVDGVLTTSLTSVLVSTSYQPEEGQNPGQLTLALISAEGFSTGASATLVRNLASGETPPLASDFTLNNLLVTDLNGVELSGYSLEIGVSRQTLNQ